MTIQILHPELAAERSADVKGECHCVHQQGDPMPSYPIMVPLNVLQPSELERLEDWCRRAWWEAHYWGRPGRAAERNLAVLRAVAYLPEAEALAFVRREWIYRGLNRALG